MCHCIVKPVDKCILKTHHSFVEYLVSPSIQAAIGSVALDTARDRGSEEELEIYGIQVGSDHPEKSNELLHILTNLRLRYQSTLIQ